MTPARTSVAYLVSRFPATSETFVVRELNAVDAVEGIDVALLSLYPPRDPTIHPSARKWVDSLSRPGAAAAARDTLWWLVRRPLRLSSSVLTIIRGHARSPGRLLRALATIPLAASHARTARSLGIEHVHAHFATYPTLSAWIVLRLAGIPYSFTAHAHDLYADQAFLARKVMDAAFAVTISDYNRRFLSDYGGGAETPVHVVHCGVDPEAFPFRPRAVPSAGRVKALCVASLEDKKGHAVLLDALAAGGRDLSRLELDLVGDGPLRTALENHVEELGLSERVRFRGGMAESAVIDLLADADIFVLPSIVARNGQMEGIPVALMEALAVGIPVVSTRISGIPELIRDGETGLLAEAGDPDSLREVLERALAGTPLDQQAGRELVETEFNVDLEARRLVALIRELPRRSA